MAALNGAIGLSDMAGKAARVAVEPSGSERDTTPAFSLNGADGTSDTRRRRDWDSRGFREQPTFDRLTNIRAHFVHRLAL